MSTAVRDENFLINPTADDATTDWYEVTADRFDIYGLFPEKGGILSRRIPYEQAKRFNYDILTMSAYGAGGRILFSTDSPYVALKVRYGKGEVATVVNHCFAYGFDVYRFDENGQDVFVNACRPVTGFDYKTAEFKVNTRNKGKMTCYTVNTPCFSEIVKLYIGVKKGSRLGRGKKYRNDKPVIFYGSSITHGAAAGRPGNIYENFISQKYNLDYRNLGFAGRARGETAMAEYLAGLDMCLFVCDYDHNAPTVEHLRNTHYPLYEAIRRKHPDVPYIMISKPDTFTDPEVSAERADVIRESYEKARAAGDENVYFIDGATLFEGEHYESCTSDGCHPNDLGMFRMAQKIGPVIARALGMEE